MLRITAGFLAKLLIVLVPFLVVPWWMKHQGWLPALAAYLGNEQSHIEKAFVAAFSIVDLLIVCLYETRAHLIPRMDGRAFASNYVTVVCSQFADQIKERGIEVGRDVRINVMIVRTVALKNSFARFEWFASRGFERAKHDCDLVLFTRQGLCGVAFRKGETQKVDLRDLPPTSRWKMWRNYWLWPTQFDKTRHLKAIVSIPIFRQSKVGAHVTYAAVGVINVDAISADGATWILAEWRALEEYFADSGTVIAHLATG